MENDWETITHVTDKESCERIFLSDKDYDYRFQRRKKAKEMPEIRPGDLVVLSEVLTPRERVVARIEGNLIFWWNGTTLYNFLDAHIMAIYRDSKQIWRRE